MNTDRLTRLDELGSFELPPKFNEREGYCIATRRHVKLDGYSLGE